MAGYKDYVLEFKLGDGTMHMIPFRVPLGENGGYYTPAIVQISDTEIEISYVPSVEDMPTIKPVVIKIPGSGGNPDYEQNDTTASDYIKNRPFYTERDEDGNETVHHLDDKYIPDSIARSEEVNAVDKKVDTLRGYVVSKFHSNIVETASGEIIQLDDAADMELAGLKIYGKTTQNGTPSPDAPVPLESVGGSGSVTVKVGISETDENPQMLTISTPNSLPGLPVNTIGNYTDENGQQWYCDEVDFTRGMYIQRIKQYVFNGDENWQNLNRDTRAFYIKLGTTGYGIYGVTLCDKLPYNDDVSDNSKSGVGFRVLTSSARGGFCLYLRLPEEYTDITTVAKFEAWLPENPLTVYIALTEPIEIPLTEEQLAQYATLHTNYPNTTIFNDGGAGMEVKYVADTKLYIDKKFAELSTALLNQ